DGGLHFVETRIILDNGVGEAALLFEGPLSALACGKRLFCPAALGGEARDALVARGIHEDDPIAKRVPTRLKQDCRVKNDGRCLPAADDARNRAFERSAHPWVDNRFESAACRGVRKNNRTKRAAIDDRNFLGLARGT